MHSVSPPGHKEIFDQALIIVCCLQLRSDVVPRTAENFRALCTGKMVEPGNASVTHGVISIAMPKVTAHA